MGSISVSYTKIYGMCYALDPNLQICYTPNLDLQMYYAQDLDPKCVMQQNEWIWTC
jgi:hypothetical protein